MKKEFLNLKEKEFYERKPTKKYSRGSFKYKIGDEEYFNIITRNISESNSIIENTKLNFGETKRQFSSVDFNSISHNNFIKLIEINFGLCSKSIKIKNNEYIYNNKTYKTNIDLFKDLPILREDKQKYYIKIIEKIEKIKTFDKLFDNFNFNFYNDKNNNNKNNVSIRSIKIEEPTQCVFSLMQKDAKFYYLGDYRYVWVRLIVVMKES